MGGPGKQPPPPLVRLLCVTQNAWEALGEKSPLLNETGTRPFPRRIHTGSCRRGLGETEKLPGVGGPDALVNVVLQP